MKNSPFTPQSVKVKTELTLPPLHVNDDPDLNLRELFVYRAARGFEKLTAKQIDYISKFGYADFLINLMNTEGKIGRKLFTTLYEQSLVEKTNEYVVFHNFRHKLQNNCRMKIARLLAKTLTHPHAK
ncbi:hypothetical protein LBMAG20_16300 [Methylocystaceae bacterium]|nr:hypothetical protein LBMAG20_16300 [Methylocystaceae bacterium]